MSAAGLLREIKVLRAGTKRPIPVYNKILQWFPRGHANWW